MVFTYTLRFKREGHYEFLIKQTKCEIENVNYSCNGKTEFSASFLYAKLLLNTYFLLLSIVKNVVLLNIFVETVIQF